MGGITEILVYGILWGFGGYLNFNSSIEIMSGMYDVHDEHDHVHHEGGNQLNEAQGSDNDSVDISDEEKKADDKEDKELEASSASSSECSHKHEEEHKDCHQEPNFENFRLSDYARIQMYLLTTFGCVDICCK